MDEIEQDVDLNNDKIVDTEVETPETEVDPKVEKPKETLEQREARLQRELKQTQKKLGKSAEEPAPAKPTGELDETQLDYLDLKGISEDEDIEVIQKVIKQTGMTVRQALKDDYVQTKLVANKAKRDVTAATPTGTKRSGTTSSSDVSLAVSKYKATGEMPTDFAFRTKVVEALEKESSSNAPSWH